MPHDLRDPWVSELSVGHDTSDGYLDHEGQISTEVYSEAREMCSSRMKHFLKRRDISHLIVVVTGVGSPRVSVDTPFSVDQRSMTHMLVQRGSAVWTERRAELLLPCCIAAGFSPETRR